MKIYIDVTNLMKVNFLTGIQRVVREVVLRMLHINECHVKLIMYKEEDCKWMLLDNGKFYKFFKEGEGEKDFIYTNTVINLKDIKAGNVFFDIDSVWNSRMSRSALLPILKNNGVKLAVFIHDIIPVTHPQYCHQNTIYNFLNYLGAYLQNADLIITSTKSTSDEINNLMDELKIEPVPIFVSWLGSDFDVKSNKQEVVSTKAIKATRKGKYVLLVGTIEPRKNHKIILEAFDKKFFQAGLNLIFVGRRGWNIESFMEKINNHKELGKNFFYLDNENDASVNYLYKNAYLVAFPTYTEGFGLPLIEAIERKVPCIANGCTVLREVGQDFCDYFDGENIDSVIEIIDKYLSDENEYLKLKNKLEEYKPITWDLVTEKIKQSLLSLKMDHELGVVQVKQMVILSARSDMLLDTLKYIEKYMTFIKEIVVCCPDNVEPIMENNYKGDLIMKFLSDSNILNGLPLPEDHSKRNFFLRCLAMRSDCIDEVFIMSDDDYRPLENIPLSMYVDNGKYIGYYCYDLEEWKGSAWDMTSFDKCMLKTKDFLIEKGMSTKMYASHMPQIIDKRLYLGLLNNNPGIEEMGLDEWSTYFNYLQTYYSDIFDYQVYNSMCWPGAPTDWKLKYAPNEYYFENFYSEEYEKNAIFYGFSQTLNNNTDEENKEKIKLFKKREIEYERYQEIYEIYKQMYIIQYREIPSFVICLNNDNVEVTVPEYIIMAQNGFFRIAIKFIGLSNYLKKSNIKLYYYYSNSLGQRISSDIECVTIDYDYMDEIEFPIYALKNSKENILNLVCEAGDLVGTNKVFVKCI